MEKLLTPAEVATSLGIGVSTLRKYSLQLEDNGMTFKRTTQNSRRYKESDVIALQRMITLMKVDSVTVENAAYTVALNLSAESPEATGSTVIHNDKERHNDDVAGVTLNEIRELKDTIKQQTETIEGFRVAQEKRDAYFVQILEDLNGQIQHLKEQQTLPEPEDSETELEISREVGKSAESVKQGFFSRLFKKKE